jgi:preprotein translocase subunit SecF
MIERIKSALQNPGIDFVSKRWYAAAFSSVLMIASVLAFVLIGPNWGIDFTGGTEIKLGFDEEVEIAEVRAALRDLGLGEDAVQKVGGGILNEFDIRIQDASFGAEEIRADILGRLEAQYGAGWILEERFDAEVGARLSVKHGGDPVMPAEVEEVLGDLDGVIVELGRDENEIVVKMPGLPQLIQERIRVAMGDRTFQVLSVDAVGPKVGGDLRRQGFLAIAATLALVLVYVGFRFDIAFAPGAVVALLHDVTITMGCSAR